MGPIVLVRGLGDVASAVAHRLFGGGYAVILFDEPKPTATRRRMAFADAAFDGEAELGGVRALRVTSTEQAEHLLASHQAIPVCLGEVMRLEPLLARIAARVLVDARMRKHMQPETQMGLAPVTIGLGPNFIAGRTVDLVVETSWGERLGEIVRAGSAMPLAGEPRSLAGHGRDRYVYAPSDGVFRTKRDIGETVRQGEEVATVDHTVLAAPLAGVIRGLTRDGVPVTARTKVIEIDPRGVAAEVSGIGERPRRIADGVLSAIRTSPGC
jgi:xanthine dehydrogenase accessory factor